MEAKKYGLKSSTWDIIQSFSWHVAYHKCTGHSHCNCWKSSFYLHHLPWNRFTIWFISERIDFTEISRNFQILQNSDVYFIIHILREIDLKNIRCAKCAILCNFGDWIYNFGKFQPKIPQRHQKFKTSKICQNNSFWALRIPTIDFT